MDKEQLYGPMPISASTAFRRIEASLKSHGKEVLPGLEKDGALFHADLAGVIFNFWISCDEEICLLDIKDGRTPEQKKEVQWLDCIGAETFRNAEDAEVWLVREIEKYCDVLPSKYKSISSSRY
jgi:hypothetical protein